MTLAPDGQAYRFTAKDPDAEYAATRFEMSPVTKTLSGAFVYTNRGLSVDKESQANAGAFCTKDYAVGVAANSKSDDVDFASFFAFGYGASSNTTTGELPVMRKVSFGVGLVNQRPR